jgi:RNA polymerase sigma-70 factor (ECF subfamily)
MPANEDQNLIKQALKDPDAFGLLFDKYYDQIYKYVLKRTGHVQAAQDITAEVFFKAYRKLWQFRWQGKPFSAWLYRIATNEANRYFKNNKRAPVPISFIEELDHLSMDEHSPELLFIAGEDARVAQEHLITLHASVQSLPTRYQEVLALRYFEQKSILEICDILRKKEGTVKSLISRGIKLLEKQLQPSEPPEVVQTEITIINNSSHEQTGN